jgi:hypothetical protein
VTLPVLTCPTCGAVGLPKRGRSVSPTTIGLHCTRCGARLKVVFKGLLKATAQLSLFGPRPIDGRE